MDRVFLYVNGILNLPGRSSNWTGRAVTHSIATKRQHAEKVEYLSLASFHRLLGQRRRVKKLARTLTFYDKPDWTINIAAHSNGCAVVVRALQYLNWPRVESLHLFSGACEHDFEKSGLKEAQQEDRIGTIHCYIGGRDMPLFFASTFVGRVFGYGALGRLGPKNYVPEKTLVVKMSEWGHSDWWSDYNFPWTMNQIITDE